MQDIGIRTSALSQTNKQTTCCPLHQIKDSFGVFLTKVVLFQAILEEVLGVLLEELNQKLLQVL